MTDQLAQARTIIQEVAEEFGIRVSDIRGRARRADIVAARITAIRRIRNETGLKLVAIACLFGRDHSTLTYHLNGRRAADAAAARSGAMED